MHWRAARGSRRERRTPPHDEIPPTTRFPPPPPLGRGVSRGGEPPHTGSFFSSFLVRYPPRSAWKRRKAARGRGWGARRGTHWPPRTAGRCGVPPRRSSQCPPPHAPAPLPRHAASEGRPPPPPPLVRRKKDRRHRPADLLTAKGVVSGKGRWRPHHHHQQKTTTKKKKRWRARRDERVGAGEWVSLVERTR